MPLRRVDRAVMTVYWSGDADGTLLQGKTRQLEWDRLHLRSGRYGNRYRVAITTEIDRSFTPIDFFFVAADVITSAWIS